MYVCVQYAFGYWWSLISLYMKFPHFYTFRELLECGIMLPAAFQGAPHSQPSEIMLSEWVSEWVSHPPQRVRAAAGCAWWCAGQCARKRRTTEAPPGFCPSSCNSGPNRVWFSFFLLSLFLYFSLLFALSLVLPFPFPFYFCLVQYSCSFSIAVLYLYLFPFFYLFPFVVRALYVPRTTF